MRSLSRIVALSIGALPLPLAATTAPIGTTGSGPFLWPLIGTTAILVGVVLLLGYFARRVGSRVRFQDDAPIQIIGARSLGTRERVVLLQVGEQQLLVGTTPTQINTLLVSDSPLVPVTPVTANPVPKFSKTLSGLLKRA